MSKRRFKVGDRVLSTYFPYEMMKTNRKLEGIVCFVSKRGGSVQVFFPQAAKEGKGHEGSPRSRIEARDKKMFPENRYGYWNVYEEQLTYLGGMYEEGEWV